MCHNVTGRAGMMRRGVTGGSGIADQRTDRSRHRQRGQDGQHDDADSMSPAHASSIPETAGRGYLDSEGAGFSERNLRQASRPWCFRGTYNDVMDAVDTPAQVATLVENHRAFLRYLERRVGDRAIAEDILQEAFAKVVARPEQAPADESVVPWFYRTLRNAAIDQFRRRSVADRAHEAFARELEMRDAPIGETEAEICACVSRLAMTLKPEYAEALQAIDVGGQPVKTFAEEKGISPNNAAVRVYRAREALKKRVTESCGTCAEHGCVDCTCGH